jgi:outer membrane protein OmpA-like peptidoglycan-associated protein
MKTLKAFLAGGALLLLASSCASRPPRELQDARAAFQSARSAPGAALTPNDQRDAKLALDRAEREFDAEGDEESTRAYAYVAQRKAVAARAKGEAVQALEEKKMAQRDFDAFKAAQATATAHELDRTKKSLEATQAEAQSERSARVAADAKADDALMKIAGLQAKQTDRGLMLTLSGSVLFVTGKSILLPQAQQRLREVATALKDDARHVTIVGHTDSKGSEEANQRLSEARANAVRTFLTKEGISADRLQATGMGESQPVSENETAEGRANNRRVEMILEAQSPSLPR